MLVDRLRELGDEILLGADLQHRRLGQVEGTERLLELGSDAVEWGVGPRGDHRPDELQRQPDRARLERRQPRWAPEGVAEELLVDVHRVPAQLGVDRITAAAEVDEVEQREVLLELFARDRETVDELLRGDVRLAVVAAGGEEVREQRLQDAEPLRCDGPRRTLGERIGDLARNLGSRFGGRAFVGPSRGARTLGHEPAQLGRLERDGASVLPQDPAGQQRERRVLGDEDVLFEPVARAVIDALDPPGRVRSNLDPGLALHVAKLPLGAAAIALDIELRRQPEVALAPCRKTDVGTDPCDPEGADVLALQVVADHIPRAVLGKQGVRVERPLLFVVAIDRPVAELHRALLRDGAFELAEAALQLGRVVGVAHLDPPGGAGGRRREVAGRAAESQVLQGEP